MIAIEVHVNNKKLCTAGLSNGTVDATVYYTNRKAWQGGKNPVLGFILHGKESEPDRHVEWTTPDLALGDEIVLRFVDASHVDGPQKREPTMNASEREEFVRSMAEEIGFKIQKK